MLFKISLNNIRKSLRDYAIYFFTLIIGVSIFYVFNAIGSQTAYLLVSKDTRAIIELLETMLSGVSVFVAAVLGLLIVYASRFLMKRRNKEFALYLILGMGKGKISAILLIETLIIGIGSLFVGLIIGIGLSQLMSALVASLFDADMSEYRFTVSPEAILKTIIYFGIMYVVVMLFNSIIIGKCKLIDLMQSSKRSEKQRLKNPVICTLIFILAAAGLGYAYYQVAYRTVYLNEGTINQMICLGAICTFLFFWSVSGLLLHIVGSMKNVYYRSLNAFTFRQISSKINTMVMSITVINLMLFVTICTLSAAFSVRNSMNANLNELCPADVMICYYKYKGNSDTMPVSDDETADIMKVYKQYGYDITEGFAEYVHFNMYAANDLTFEAFCGDEFETIKEEYTFLDYSSREDIIRVSDYNKVAELYGNEILELNEDEYVLLCDYQSMKNIRDDILASGGEITVFGHDLKPRYSQCKPGFVELAAQHINAGIFVVPDSTVAGSGSTQDFFIGNYKAETRNGKAASEERMEEICQDIKNKIEAENDNEYWISNNTRIDISEAAIGLGAMIALLGLYIGVVFLISCGAILALKELSDSTDSIQRYAILRKIGVEESDISRSLFRQTGIFFLLPLLLACVHSFFGMKFAMLFLEIFGTEKLTESVLSTSVIILLIYGGYFLITYFCSKSIIRESR